MRKAKTIRWFTFLLLLPAFLLGTGQPASTVLAADSHLENEKQGCTYGQQIPSFDGTILVGTNQVTCGELTAFGGTVTINGEVRGDVVAFGGNIVIAGMVDGNVDLYAGRLTLQSGSHIYGDINLYAGNVVPAYGAQLDGAVTDHTKHPEALFFSNREFNFPFWSILLWLVLGVLLTSLLPEHLLFVRTTVVTSLRRSSIIGLLSALLTLPILLVLMALILTIPLAIIIVLGLIAAWALGTVAIGWLVGERILRMVAPHSIHHNTRSVQVVVGLTVLVLAGSLPYIGHYITIGVGLLGLGAVCLSRFGTRLYNRPKQPLTL